MKLRKKGRSDLRLLYKTLLLFCYIYSFKLIAFPISTRWLSVFLFTCMFLLKLHAKKGRFSFKNYLNRYQTVCYWSCFFTLAISCLYSLFVAIYNGMQNDAHVIYPSYIQVMVLAFIIPYIIVYCFRKEELIKSFIYINIMQSCILIGDFFINPFKQFLYDNIMNGTNISYLAPRRAIGVGGGGSQLTVVMTIAIVLICIRIMQMHKVKISYVVSVLFIIFGELLAARTGFVLALAFLVYTFFHEIVNLSVPPHRKALFIVTPIVLAIVMIIIFTFILGRNNNFHEIVERNFELSRYSIFNKRSFWAGLFSQDIKFTVGSFLFGTGVTRGEILLSRMHSDSGLLRTIFGSGFIIILITYTSIARFLTSLVQRKFGRIVRCGLVFLITCMYIVDLKETFVINAAFMPSLLILLFNFNREGALGIEKNVTTKS